MILRFLKSKKDTKLNGGLNKRTVKKKIFLVFSVFSLFFMTPIFANISTIRYAHETVFALKNITIPIENNLNPTGIHTMKYLMELIDRANEKLNGWPTTDYTNSDMATPKLVDTQRAMNDIDELINRFEPFELTLTGVDAFSFYISASGVFSVDWGDGTVDEINKTNTTNTIYSHTYSVTGNYTVKIRGKATGYNIGIAVAAISFQNNPNIKSISGSLGKIFSTLPDGTNPKFYNTFSYCSGLTGSIPAELFAGISGAPVADMFNFTFNGCGGLTGSIPGELFAGISGPPAESMFSSTFNGCGGLTGSIPGELFAGISGPPVTYMFSSTFSGCGGLTGSIPADLFAGISGAPARGMFRDTFSGCGGLTGSIPADLFAGISGAPANSMFSRTFGYCSGLTGSIPPGLFGKLSGAPAVSMFEYTFYYCSGLTSIPSRLFAGISGAPAQDMFRGTFGYCSGLTGSIPPGLFGKLSGAPAASMFAVTFSDCSGLTGSIPTGLFGRFSGAPAAYMFSGTFANCTGLTGIDDGIWDLSGITNTSAAHMFSSTFSNCGNIASPSPSVSPGYPTKLWQKFTIYTGQGAFRGVSKMADYASIPDAWKY